MSLIQIEVPNWEKYNPKRDQKTYTWFRLNNDIFTGQRFFRLSNVDKLIWILILCIASRENRAKIDFDPGYAKFILKISEKEIAKSLELLAESKLIILVSYPRESGVVATTPKDSSYYTYERTNERTDGRGSNDLEKHSLSPLAQIWNDFCGTLPKVVKTNAKRNKKADAIYKELNPEEWPEVITRISKSDFCSGKNDRSWKATFDWLLQPETYLKVLEGKYDNKMANSKAMDEDQGWG